MPRRKVIRFASQSFFLESLQTLTLHEPADVLPGCWDEVYVYVTVPLEILIPESLNFPWSEVHWSTTYHSPFCAVGLHTSMHTVMHTVANSSNCVYPSIIFWPSDHRQNNHQRRHHPDPQWGNRTLCMVCASNLHGWGFPWEHRKHRVAESSAATPSMGDSPGHDFWQGTRKFQVGVLWNFWLWNPLANFG